MFEHGQPVKEVFSSPLKSNYDKAKEDATGTLDFELFWVPGEDTEVLTMDEVTLDWPELLPC